MQEPVYRDITDTGLSEDQFRQILCPNLRIGVRMGLLNPDANGWVSEQELCQFMIFIGVVENSYIEKVLINLGKNAIAEKREGYVKITDFKGTFLDHGSSSAILNNPAGFSQERLDLLKSFADEKGKITYDALCSAQNNFHRCPFNFKSLRGTNIQSFELAAILNIYGRKDSTTNKKYFTCSDIDDIWQYARFPSTWKIPEEPHCGTRQSCRNYLLMIIRRLFLRWKRKRQNPSSLDSCNL